jgi:hypothetical protein
MQNTLDNFLTSLYSLPSNAEKWKDTKVIGGNIIYQGRMLCQGKTLREINEQLKNLLAN